LPLSIGKNMGKRELIVFSICACLLLVFVAHLVLDTNLLSNVNSTDDTGSDGNSSVDNQTGDSDTSDTDTSTGDNTDTSAGDSDTSSTDTSTDARAIEYIEYIDFTKFIQNLSPKPRRKTKILL
jgi:hypothetical protein